MSKSIDVIEAWWRNKIEENKWQDKYNMSIFVARDHTQGEIGMSYLLIRWKKTKEREYLVRLDESLLEDEPERLADLLHGSYQDVVNDLKQH